MPPSEEVSGGPGLRSLAPEPVVLSLPHSLLSSVKVRCRPPSFRTCLLLPPHILPSASRSLASAALLRTPGSGLWRTAESDVGSGPLCRLAADTATLRPRVPGLRAAGATSGGDLCLPSRNCLPASPLSWPSGPSVSSVWRWYSLRPEPLVPPPGPCSLLEAAGMTGHWVACGHQRFLLEADGDSLKSRALNSSFLLTPGPEEEEGSKSG